MAKILHTPGVYRSETDLSQVFLPGGISNGGIVISSPKGPINRPVLITNKQDFADTFGAPVFTSGTADFTTTDLGGSTPKAYKGFYPEYGYGAVAALEYLNQAPIWVVRSVTPPTTATAGDNYANTNLIVNDTSGSITTSSSAISARGISASNVTIPDRLNRIQNIDTYASVTMDRANLVVGSLSPGYDGNNIAVTLTPFSPSATWISKIDGQPTNSAAWPQNMSESSFTNTSATFYYPNDSQVMQLNVYKKNSEDSWTKYYQTSDDATNFRLKNLQPVEQFLVSLNKIKDALHTSLFVEDVVNGLSKFIYVKVGASSTFSYTFTKDPTVLPDQFDSNGNSFIKNIPSLFLQCAGGTVQYPSKAGLGSDASAWKLFENREFSNPGILIAPTFNATAKTEIARIAAKRADCIAIFQTGAPFQESVTDIINSETYAYENASYVALYCGWSNYTDPNNDNYKMVVPNAIFGAEIIAKMQNPWDAPAGVNRGSLPGTVDSQRRIFTFEEIGKLYDKNINAVRSLPTGNVLWGQKTAQLIHTALDRINVRETLLFIENNIELILNNFVFENNNQKTRSRIFTQADPFLLSVKINGGLYDYKLVVDETNNTPDVIDNNQLNVDLYVQPTKTAEFISLRTIVTRTGVSTAEV